ncbi:unnamed protein product, partial [Pylaiella littoralis]
VYRSELLKEQLREIEVLHLDSREQRLHAAKTMQEQITAADRIIRTLKRYGLVGNMEDIHYVKYAADAARRSGLSQTEDSQPEASKGSCAIGRAGNTKGKGKSGGGWQHEVSNGARVWAAKRSGLQRDTIDDADDEMSPYSVDLVRPRASVAVKTKPSDARRGRPSASPMDVGRGPRASKPRPAERSRLGESAETTSAAAQEAQRARVQMERLRTFSLAGHPLRQGVEDDTTAVPALIPIPEGFGQVGGAQKSYAAGRIIDALRADRVDSITGRRKRIAVPLWHRATDGVDSSGAGSVLYSDLIGHTYSVLQGPKPGVVAREKANG